MRSDNLLLTEIKIKHKLLTIQDHSYRMRFFKVHDVGPGFDRSHGLEPITDIKVGDVVMANTSSEVSVEMDGKGYIILPAGNVDCVVEDFSVPEGYEIQE
jgi:co-chaperonin GroES (HSP10)